MRPPPGQQATSSTTGRPADIRVSKATRHRLAHALTEVAGIRFATARAVIAERVALGETPDEIEAYLRSTYRLDPTGVTAARNVDRERSRP